MGRKDEQLGMPFGTASGKLRKKVLFHLLQKFELNVCVRCSETINNEDDLSMEHIEPWLDSDDPVKLFFDLNNIAFSHLSCNSGAKRSWNKGNKAPHGRYSRYVAHSCRCEECRAANARRREQQRCGTKQTGLAEQADALVSNSSGETREGSTPLARTMPE